MAKTMKAFLVYYPSSDVKPYGVVLEASEKEAAEQVKGLGNVRIEEIPFVVLGLSRRQKKDD